MHDQQTVTCQISEDASQWQYIRTEVFIKEQGFQHEFDAIDNRAVHVCAYLEGAAVGCLRLFRDEADTVCWHLGRLAVLPPYRHQQIASMLVRYAQTFLTAYGAQRIILDAQCYLQAFYEGLGYTVCGERFFDEHTEHIPMQKLLVNEEMAC